jgi:prevent-host-death family protein
MKTELVTTLKRQATRLISKLQEDKLPILITEHGKPAAYLIDVQSFEMQQTRIDILEGIALGERAIQEGRIMTREQAKRRMKKWLV